MLLLRGYNGFLVELSIVQLEQGALNILFFNF